MHTPRLHTGRRALACLLMLTALAAHGAETAKPLPEGWTPLALPTLSGNFLPADSSATAVLVQNGQQGPYGLAVLPASGSGEQARIVKTFHDIKANPPQLSLIKPGSYQPVCHGATDCAPLSIATEAIGLCFGEASCEIIYYHGGSFRELAVTD